MIEKLKDLLNEFLNITKKIIDELEKDNFDSLQPLFSNRETIIEQIRQLQYEKEVFKSLCNDFGIVKINTNLEMLMKEKYDNTKGELKKIANHKNVNNNYHKSNYVDSIFFNKKI